MEGDTNSSAGSSGTATNRSRTDLIDGRPAPLTQLLGAADPRGINGCIDHGIKCLERLKTQRQQIAALKLNSGINEDFKISKIESLKKGHEAVIGNSAEIVKATVDELSHNSDLTKMFLGTSVAKFLFALNEEGSSETLNSALEEFKSIHQPTIINRDQFITLANDELSARQGHDDALSATQHADAVSGRVKEVKAGTESSDLRVSDGDSIDFGGEQSVSVPVPSPSHDTKRVYPPTPYSNDLGPNGRPRVDPNKKKSGRGNAASKNSRRGGSPLPNYNQAALQEAVNAQHFIPQQHVDDRQNRIRDLKKIDPNAHYTANLKVPDKKKTVTKDLGRSALADLVDSVQKMPGQHVCEFTELGPNKGKLYAAKSWSHGGYKSSAEYNIEAKGDGSFEVSAESISRFQGDRAASNYFKRTQQMCGYSGYGASLACKNVAQLTVEMGMRQVYSHDYASIKSKGRVGTEGVGNVAFKSESKEMDAALKNAIEYQLSHNLSREKKMARIFKNNISLELSDDSMMHFDFNKGKLKTDPSGAGYDFKNDKEAQKFEALGKGRFTNKEVERIGTRIAVEPGASTSERNRKIIKDFRETKIQIEQEKALNDIMKVKKKVGRNTAQGGRLEAQMEKRIAKVHEGLRNFEVKMQGGVVAAGGPAGENIANHFSSSNTDTVTAYPAAAVSKKQMDAAVREVGNFTSQKADGEPGEMAFPITKGNMLKEDIPKVDYVLMGRMKKDGKKMSSTATRVELHKGGKEMVFRQMSVPSKAKEPITTKNKMSTKDRARMAEDVILMTLRTKKACGTDINFTCTSKHMEKSMLKAMSKLNENYPGVFEGREIKIGAKYVTTQKSGSAFGSKTHFRLTDKKPADVAKASFSAPNKPKR